jgi:TatD DNase family protein
MFIDSHCHIQFKSFADDYKDVVARSIEKGCIMNTIGTQMATSKRAVELAEQYDEIYATVGLHPIQSKKVSVEEEQYVSFVARGEDFDTAYYRELIQSSKKVIAVGETGLDAYHVPKDELLADVFEHQWALFLKHYELAEEFDLPLVLHVRDAHEEMIRRLEQIPPLVGEARWGLQQESADSIKERPPLTPPTRGRTFRGVVHCFTGNWQQAQAYLDLGFYLGFTGVITFPPKKTDPAPQEALLEVVDTIPIDRILVETDAPFLAPQAYRGQRCEPWMTEEVIKFIAERRGIDVGVFREQTVENTKNLFTRIT